jgi:hypothetical protein
MAYEVRQVILHTIKFETSVGYLNIVGGYS